MSNLIQWIRRNMIVVSCLLVVVLSLGSMFWPTGSKVAEYQDQVDDVANRQSRLRSLTRRSVELPAPEPGGDPQSVNFTINEASVRQLEQVFDQMQGNYQQLLDVVVGYNRSGPGNANPHETMLRGLFPQGGGDAIRYSGRSAYLEGLTRLYQMLDAGQPPTPEELARARTEAEQKYMVNNVLSPTGGLMQAQQQELARLQQEAVRDRIVNRARDIVVYAPRVVFSGQQFQPGFFQVGPWARETGAPTMAILWDAQMKLWIQQDLIQAILRANRGEDNDRRISVIEAPVKRVISFSVFPGYIGIPATGLSEEDVPDPDQKLEPTFAGSPTGRTSNPLYDVRHVQMSVLVDSKGIPALLNALGRVNFMTPIVTKITDINERQEFLAGFYYYGDVDVVQLDVLVETLWMRQWTAGISDEQAIEQYEQTHPNDAAFAARSPEEKIAFLKQNNLYNEGLMPDMVRWRLGMEARSEDFQPPAQREDGGAPTGQYSPYGPGGGGYSPY